MPLHHPLIRAIPTVARVPHRAVLSIGGSQANQFLNGLLTSSVHEPIRPLFSAFLHAQGRVLHDVFLYTTSDSAGKPSYLLEYDSRPSEAPPLISLLKRYVLRSKVKLRDVSSEYVVWATWGDSPEDLPRHWTWAQSGVVQPSWDAGRWPWGEKHNTILDRRAVGMGKRMLVRQGDLPQESSHYQPGSSEAYTLHRMMHGVPEGQVDIPAMQAFPMESNLDVMGALEFRKGCYVGQELTVRTYHTGVIRKRILPVVIHRPNAEPQEPITPSAIVPSFPNNIDIRPIINTELDDNRTIPRPRGSGKLLTSYQGIGLALLRLEHAEGVERGDLKLQFKAMTEAGEDTWAVTHWWPDWWPRQPLS